MSLSSWHNGPSLDINHWFWRLCENYIYCTTEPPPRVREKPMRVLCVGLPRSGTESLQMALNELGEVAYHGWDILFEEPHRMVEWVRLGRRRFYPRTEQEGKTAISAPDFDRIIGHATALVDALASCFAQDLIKAYPDAKVVLNLRGDIDAWQRSATINIAAGSVTPAFMYLHWFDRELWWMWHVYIRVLWKGLFQCFDGQLMSGIGKNGWRIYEQHVAMVRGLCKGREDDMYLEWKVEDGWGPLCEFLGKQVPDKPFPRANDRKAFKVREQDILRRTGFRAVRNLAIFVTTLVTAGLSVWWRM